MNEIGTGSDYEMTNVVTEPGFCSRAGWILKRTRDKPGGQCFSSLREAEGTPSWRFEEALYTLRQRLIFVKLAGIVYEVRTHP